MKTKSDRQAASSRKLDSLNQQIWEEGFSLENLARLEQLTQEVYHGITLFERIPQAQQPGLSRGSALLCSAAIICRGCPGTESEKRPLYDTDDLVGEGNIQCRFVEAFAKISGHWFPDPLLYLSSLSQAVDIGTESTVFFDVRTRLVRKFITLKHYNVLRLALDRLIIHNALFSDAALRVIGFGRSRDGSFGILAEQPYIEGVVVPERERLDFMLRMGFSEAGEDYGMHLNYKTESLYVGDLNEYNLLQLENGSIQVFDADCRLNVPSLGCGGTWAISPAGVDFSRPCAIRD